MENNRPPIEEFLELCKNKTPGEWDVVFGNGHVFTRADVRGDIICEQPDKNEYEDSSTNFINGNGKFIAVAGTHAESIAKYALLMEKAFEIAVNNVSDCLNHQCTQKGITCLECNREFIIQEAQRQLKEETDEQAKP